MSAAITKVIIELEKQLKRAKEDSDMKLEWFKESEVQVLDLIETINELREAQAIL